MLDNSGRITGKRTTEGLSEDLRKERMKQRPRRSPGEDDQSQLKDMEQEWEDAKKRAKLLDRNKSPQELMALFGEKGNVKFAKALARKALESGKETGTPMKSYAPELSEEEIQELAKISIGDNDEMLIDKESPFLPQKPVAGVAPVAPESVPLPQQSATPLEPTPLVGEAPPVQAKAGEAAVPMKPKLVGNDAEETVVLPQQGAVQPEGIQPMVAGAQSQAPVKLPQELIEVIQQVSKHMEQVSFTDRTETMVTLKHPPLFAGVQVTLTEFKSAKGEFNVSFTNLSPEAKALVDLPAHQDALRLALENKGYPLHIVTTSQESREQLLAASRSHDAERDGQQGQRDDEQEEQGEDA